MKSKITLIVLVVIIIFLGALSFFFWYQSYDANNKVDDLSTKLDVFLTGEESENAGTTENKETPKDVSLDNDIVKRMYNILNLTQGIYDEKGRKVKRENLKNDEIQRVAYYIIISGNYEKFEMTRRGDFTVGGKFPKSTMDAAVKEIFGDISYEPCFLNGGVCPIATYDEQEQMYYVCTGYGGGGYSSYPIKGINKIEEYSDRYEVYEEYLFVRSNDGFQGTDNELKTWHSDASKILLEFSGLESQLQDSVKDIVPDNIYVGDMSDCSEDYKDHLVENQKILTKYKDEASLYKHTFMKNEDGSFYWAKSELVK